MSLPDTPLHCNPDELSRLDRLKEIDESEIDELDLNPELNDNGDIDMSQDGYSESPDNKRAASVLDEDISDDVDDFKPRIDIGSPFSSQTNMVSQVNPTSSGIPTRRLSLSQQSKFITYCDEKLMSIQRKFVQSRGLNYNMSGYENLESLLKDLKSFTDFIWYSVEGIPNSDYLLKQDLYLFEKEFNMKNASLPVDRARSFGQTSYLLRIADDLLEFTEKFDLTELSLDEKTSTVSKLFKLLFILDKIFARIIDGTIPGKVKMTGTDAVRLCGIAERTRMKLPTYFETQNIQGYHFELSKIYLESLERCAT
ncbi:hypothetical protein TPHA_0N00360 [Tetrapisispora phaffii CBS 4417]|uniref:Uncharacterized protein n=1 Tax=Tetrapisispora phaffii (strain ATCC 24235 / CBS 4417 / NBRC 1672 / NRRL Y-8282 / UCD 70-5) TaxID=1071381 RepID=G8C0Y9_TETPH|nr:hypothetical protein TPHA_0N00360 [Tetrapisispora phaffii CBS 4417]CCE65817.1 hypothetical protein TPHA_0N00360 [Tetrapisispora phaffii CBS 4417]